ncbi:hypothetical protein EV356DRAFT_137734 [Viridothelium virens]|uniref:Uncharacterized protein n=1 Tax=Viridothelium virens TaxID=1048519 RepID=A0A6A6HAK7_VIRVR|nr:hypothetical protein EV356DRAFT_137734 [Viridothelium virens]
MASGSYLQHSPTDSQTSTPFQNGHMSPSADNMATTGNSHYASESELSDIEHPSRPLNTSPEDLDQSSTPASKASGSPLTDTATDEDADGDEDADYDMEMTPNIAVTAQATEKSSSSSPARASKRKMSTAEDDYMRENPELYGLRRSGRARPSRRVIESSSDEESDEPRRKKRKPEIQPKGSTRATPARTTTTTSPESESDFDTRAGSRRRNVTSRKRNRLQKDGTLAAPPQRFSERRTAKVANYNEDEEPFSDEETATPVDWTWEADDPTPGIDIVMDAKLKEGLEKKENPSKYDFLFWVKWQGRAHYHATWETWDTLGQYKGWKRLDNFWRDFKLWQEKLSDPEFPDEEKEQHAMDINLRLDHFADCVIVERVIGSRDGEDGTEYCILWKGCEYKDTTWEPASLVSKLAQEEIDRFLDRTSHIPVSNLDELRPRKRSEYKGFHEQPDYIQHGRLRHFQLEGVNFLAYNWCRNENVILADEMGLGKTIQTISFLNWLRHERGQQGPFLLIVPLSTVGDWADTFNKWTPDVNYIKYLGGPNSRSIIKERELFTNSNSRRYKFHVLLTTPEYVNKDQDFLCTIKWQSLMVDEAHRLKNPKANIYQILMGFGIPHRTLITGTPMQNNYAELAALLNFLKPGQGDIADEVDLDDQTAAQKVAEIRKIIDPLVMRRTKNKVEKDLPPKSEKIIRVALSDYQLEYYKNILAKNYTALNQGGKGQKASLLNITMQLKKCSNHAFLVPIAEQRRLDGIDPDDRKEILKQIITCSGKMMVLEKLLTKLKAEGHRVLIFSQMVQMLNILEEYCRLKGEKFQRLDGTVSSRERAQAIDHFNSPDSEDFLFLLSTRAGGLGINLTAADTVIIFDSDWNPQADLQAMARAHRIGQTKPVQVFRFVSKDTLEEDILERARNKMILEYLTIQQGITDKDAKDLGDSGLAKRAGEPGSIEDINRLLKRRGQRMFEQTGNQKELESMDIDAVIATAEEHKTEQAEGIGASGGEDFLKSFEYTDVKADIEWDDIIPEDQIKQVKDEERKAEEERMTQELLKQAEPRKRKAPSDGHEAREQRAAKKQARAAAAAAAADEDDTEGDAEANLDPKRPLSEREVRNLVRAHEKYGSIDDCRNEFLKDARLEGRDMDVLKATLGEITTKADQLMHDEEERLKALERETNKALTKKERKAVLFDHRGVKRLNADTITQRPTEMRMMREVVKAASDWKSFRVPEASKPAQYDCPWGAREDGMLCVGIARHGYGAWVAIRDDPDLGMGDKFFLEEHRVDKKAEREGHEDKHAKSPGAVHLVRRANYLIQVLKDKTSGGTNIAVKKALENHHRNSKKHPGLHRHRMEKSVTSSPGPTTMRKVPSSDQFHRPRGPNHRDSRQRLFSADPNGKATPDRKSNGYAGTPDRKRKAEDDHDDARKPRPKHARSDEQLNAIKIQKRSHALKNDHSSAGPRRHSTEMSQTKQKDATHTHLRNTEDTSNKKPAASDSTLCHEFRDRENNYQKLKDLRASTKQNYQGTDLARRLVQTLVDVGLTIVEEVKKTKGSSDLLYWDYVAGRYWPNPSAQADGRRLKEQFEKYHAKTMKLENGDGAKSTKTEAGTTTNMANGVHMNGGSSSNGSNGTA